MKKQYFLAHSYFTLAVLLLSLIPMACYWWMMPNPDSLHSKLYLLTSVGYYGLLLSVVALVLSPLASTRWTRPLYALLLASWLIYLCVDTATFNLYHFHVDWIMLEMFLLDFEGLGLPLIIMVAAAAAALSIASLCWWLNQRAYKNAERNNFRARPLILFVSITLTLFAMNSSLNIWADKYHRQEVSYINPYLPVYRPVTSSKHAAMLTRLLPDLLPAEQGQMNPVALQEKSVVRYPLETLQCAAPTTATTETTSSTPSIIMLVVESWQATALNPDVMPNVVRFSKNTTRFSQHISGGSATIPGLFSLFYGLHASYYPAFKATPAANPSAFTEQLSTQGFEQRIFTNSNLDRFAMRSLIFPRVPKGNFYQAKTDATVVNNFLQKNAQKNTQPRFDFVFLTSSHSPYKYPKHFSRFTPLPSVKGGYAFNKNTDNTAYKNDYYNSLFYVDNLLGKILTQLEKTGALDNSWVIITGDHAEEFNENGAGFWGHGSNFTRWQTHTPLLIHAPGQKIARQENKVSSHQDIVPTLMQEVLGCNTAREAYSTGANLFALPEKRTLVMSSYYNNAYWIDGTVLDRSTGKQYAWSDFNKTDNTVDKQKLHQLQDEERRFFRAAKAHTLLSSKN